MIHIQSQSQTVIYTLPYDSHKSGCVIWQSRFTAQSYWGCCHRSTRMPKLPPLYLCCQEGNTVLEVGSHCGTVGTCIYTCSLAGVFQVTQCRAFRGKRGLEFGGSLYCHLTPLPASALNLWSVVLLSTSIGFCRHNMLCSTSVTEIMTFPLVIAGMEFIPQWIGKFSAYSSP